MKLEKKHWIMLIAGVVVLYLVYWFFFRNSKKSESSYDPYLPIFGGGMLENNYSASMLDPKGIESGYSAMQLDPRGIESGYGTVGGTRKSCPCGSGGIISSPQCCRTAMTASRTSGTAGPQQIGNCGTGWKPCYYCTGGYDNKGDCLSWTQYCCRGGSVSMVPKLGFESGYMMKKSGTAGRLVSGGKCLRCTGDCTPPCPSCQELVDCPNSVPASPI